MVNWCIKQMGRLMLVTENGNLNRFRMNQSITAHTETQAATAIAIHTHTHEKVSSSAPFHFAGIPLVTVTAIIAVS